MQKASNLSLILLLALELNLDATCFKSVLLQFEKSVKFVFTLSNDRNSFQCFWSNKLSSTSKSRLIRSSFPANVEVEEYGELY